MRTRYSFMCMSLASRSIANVINSLLVTRAGVYLKSGITSSLLNQYPALSGVLNGSHVETPTGTSFSLTTVGGVPFTLFAKNEEWDSFLYEDLGM